MFPTFSSRAVGLCCQLWTGFTISFLRWGCRPCCLSVYGRCGDPSRQTHHCPPICGNTFSKGVMFTIYLLLIIFSTWEWLFLTILFGFMLVFYEGELSDRPILLLLEVVVLELLCGLWKTNNFFMSVLLVYQCLCFHRKNEVFLNSMSPLWSYFPT